MSATPSDGSIDVPAAPLLAAAAPAPEPHAPIVTLGGIADYFWQRPLVGQHRSDMGFHATRWAYLLSHVEALVQQCPEPGAARILDIGVSLQTQLLKHNYPGRVDTIDIVESGIPDEGEQAIRFDLNELFYEERRPALGPYDVVVMCEVIEHLYTAADSALAGIASWLRPGGFVFVQTPNAAALHKRAELLAGRNPYMDLATITRDEPPHYHEYTMDELTAAGRRAGLEVIDGEARNYFTGSRPGTALYNLLCERLPPGFRAGLSVSYRRPQA